MKRVSFSISKRESVACFRSAASRSQLHWSNCFIRLCSTTTTLDEAPVPSAGTQDPQNKNDQKPVLLNHLAYYSHSPRSNHEKPLVILHGLFGRGMNWRTIAKKVGTEMDALLVDLRNHGHSPHSDLMSYPAMVSDVVFLLDFLKIKSPYVLGHSMGGIVAMRMALSHPERVQKLVVVDVAPKLDSSSSKALRDDKTGQREDPSSSFQAYVNAMLAIDLSKVNSRDDVDRALVPTVKDPVVRSFLLTNIAVDERTKKLSWKVNLPVISKFLADIRNFDLSEYQNTAYQGPALFIGGKKSNYITPQSTPTIKKLFPKAEIAMVEGAGHWVHFEKPTEFTHLLTQFITHH